MTEPIGPMSGLPTLVTAAHMSTFNLDSTVQSFQNHTERVHKFREELDTLMDALILPTKTVSTTTNGNLSALNLPSPGCENARKEIK